MPYALSIILCLFGSLLASSAQDVHELMARARYVTTLSKTDLEGRLKKSSLEIPVKFSLNGENLMVQYYVDSLWKGLHVKLNPTNCQLFDINADGSESLFSDQKIGQDIAGTDLSYEDLSLRFLYWPVAELKGEERIKSQNCYIVRVHNPDQKGNYLYCDLWLHQKASNLMQVKAYDRNEQHCKTLQAADLMNVDGEIMMRKMKVEVVKNGDTQSISYLIFKNPEGPKSSSRRRSLR